MTENLSPANELFAMLGEKDLHFLGHFSCARQAKVLEVVAVVTGMAQKGQFLSPITAQEARALVPEISPLAQEFFGSLYNHRPAGGDWAIALQKAREHKNLPDSEGKIEAAQALAKAVYNLTLAKIPPTKTKIFKLNSAAAWQSAPEIAKRAKMAVLYSVLSPTPNNQGPDYHLLRILALGPTEAKLVKRGNRERLAVHFLSESGKTIEKSFSPLGSS